MPRTSSRPRRRAPFKMKRLPSYLINRGRTKSSQPSTILSQSSDPTQRISTNIINSSNTAQSIPPPLSFHHRYDYHDPIFKKADKPLHQYLSPNNFPYYPILSSDQMANKKIVYHDTCMGIKHKYITSNAWNLHLNTPHNHPCANAPHCPLQFVEQWHVQKHIPLCKASPLLKAIREGKKQFKFPPYIEPNEPQFMCYPGNPISIPFPNLHTQQHAHPKAQCISNSTRAIDTMSNPLLTPFISQAHSLSNTAQSIPPSIPTKGSATQQKRRKARKLKRIEKKKHKKKKHKKQKKNSSSKTKNNNNNYDEMEVDAQSGCIRILTRWIRRRLPKQDDDDDDDHKTIEASTEELKIIDTLLITHYNTIFEYIKFCRDPHVLANAPLLLKQFIIYAKLNEDTKPHLKKLIKKHSKKKLHSLMALFTNQHVTIIQNAVTCMAQLATLDDELRIKIREMGGLKAMSQLHMQHRHSLFK
eukprot:118501_1